MVWSTLKTRIRTLQMFSVSHFWLGAAQPRSLLGVCVMLTPSLEISPEFQLSKFPFLTAIPMLSQDIHWERAQQLTFPVSTWPSVPISTTFNSTFPGSQAPSLLWPSGKCLVSRLQVILERNESQLTMMAQMVVFRLGRGEKIPRNQNITMFKRWDYRHQFWFTLDYIFPHMTIKHYKNKTSHSIVTRMHSKET